MEPYHYVQGFAVPACRPIIILFLFLFQFVVLNSSQAAESPFWRVSTVPQWVVQHPAVASKVSDKRLPSANFLVTDTQVNLKTKQVHFYRHLRLQVNDVRGIEDNSDIKITFNPDFQRIELHHIEIHRQHHKLNRLFTKDIRLIDLETEQHNKLYSGEKQLQLWLKDVRAGDIIDYSFSVIGENPVFAGNFSQTFGLGWRDNVAQVWVSVVSPKARPLSTQVVNLDTKVKVESLANALRYSVHLEDVPAYDEDGQAPSWDNVYPFWQVTSFQTWQEVSNWAEQLFNLPEDDSPAFTKWLADLKTKPTQLAIEKAIAFAQQEVRYLGIEIAENSHRPHQPSQVFDNRYGDCKDKSLLLVRALRAIGVEAYPVLVSSYKRNTIGDSLPSYNAFNHAIVRMTYQNRQYWIDPTNAYQASQLQTIVPANFGQALVIAPGNTGLTTMPELNASDNLVDVSETFRAADYQSPVLLTVNSVFTGTEAERIRYDMANQSIKRLSQAYLEYYQRYYPALRALQDININDDKISNRIEVKEHYVLDDFWRLEQADAVFSLYSSSLDYYLRVPKKIDRRQAYALGGPITVSHQSKLILPYDVDFSALNDEQLFEDDYFKFSATFDSHYRTLIYQQRYQNKQAAVDAKGVRAFAKLMREARKQLDISYSITNVTSDPAYQSMNQLVNFLLNKKQATEQGE